MSYYDIMGIPFGAGSKYEKTVFRPPFINHRGCEHAFAPKKELKVFSIPKHSITSKASVFPKNKIRN